MTLGYSLPQVIMALSYALGQADIQSDVPPDRCIWWPRLVQKYEGFKCFVFIISCSTIGEVSNTLQCRGMSS